jgi:hypothetical protein
MRLLGIALFLVCAPAWATNVLYAPFIDPLTHQRNILYLTDLHSSDCAGEWRTAHVEENNGKPVPTTPICWSFGNDNGFDIAFLSTGYVSHDGAFSRVPGALPAWQAVLADRMKSLQKNAENQMRAYGPGLNPHP